MNEPPTLTGAVAAVLNDRELALNIGAEAGVREGMRFQVLEKERLITDPTTREELGRVQREKVKIKVVEVHPRFSVARTFETYPAQPGLATAGLWAARNLAAVIGSEPEIRVRTLRHQDRPSGFSEISESASYVQIGDPVRLLEMVEVSRAIERQQKAG